MERNQKQFIRMAEEVGENSVEGTDAFGVSCWLTRARRSVLLISIGSGWSHLYDSIVNAVTMAVNNPAC